MTSESTSRIQHAGDLPRERLHFKELLLEDYFKLQPPPAGPPQGDTNYEQLVCIGYRPQLKRLDGVVQIKQPVGYSGGICTAGSQEYVRFFASTDGGATWTDLGLTSFTVWDVPGPKPLDFDVSIPVDLAAKCCKDVNLVLIRGILSWEVPPTSPTGPVVFGNGLDVTVQVAPFTLGTLADLLLCLPFPVELESVSEVASLDQVIEFAPAEQLTPRQLADLYRDTQVPQSRYLLSQVTELLDDPAALSAAAAGQPVPILGGDADLKAIIGAIIDPQGDEYYEQLGCIGLNTVTDQLAATIDVKQSAGYSGGPCTSGSQEYVAFWVDWGTGGGFEYAGTVSVNVHDIAPIPAGGLQYSVGLPFPQALTKRKPCQDGPLIVTVRAVLSWNTPPSTTNPFAVPVWGGHLEALVLIPPGQPVTGGGPVLESIGSMPLPTISDATGQATGTSLIPQIGYADACPFGGALEFTGHVINPATGLFGGAGMQYRILVSTNGGFTATPMTQEFSVFLSTSPFPVLQKPDPNGWVDYLEVSGVVDVVGNILGSWTTSGDGQLWISMEARQGVVPIGTPTPWKLVQLDNTPPDPGIVQITSGGGSCGDFFQGDTIVGKYSVTDNENLRSVSIVVEPFMGPEPVKTVVSKTLVAESGTWSLQTQPTTEPCGYVIIVTAADNTIVNSGVVGFEAQAFAGFCLRAAKAG